MNESVDTAAFTHGPPRLERTHLKPRLQALLQSLRIDVSYERGAGDFLYYRDATGAEIEVLDLVGGYGALLLGHSHPALVAEAQRLLLAGRPFHAQGSRREPAARLARELSRRAGADYCVVFGNSGAEAVEAALKHAMLETGARTFIALERGFHGKTLGALQVTAGASHREPFNVSGLDVVRVPANDVVALEAAFARCTDLAGFLFEPIQGEGGVRVLTREFVQRAAELCAQRDVPLIADECQTGIGRTGTFLACEQLGVQPDYLVLSKALGGGLAKISALLVRRERYCGEFDLKHSSTYAEDDFSSAIALEVLERIDDGLLAACRSKGDRLLSGLRELGARYPGVIAEVRGRGLMLAVQFRRLDSSPSFLLRFVSSQDEVAYLATSYLLNAHRIRIAPTLSEPFTLRIEPSTLISEQAIDRFLQAMEDLCSALARADALKLTRHFAVGREDSGATSRYVRAEPKIVAFDEPRFRARHEAAPSTRVAWLCHLVDADDLISLEPSFAYLSLAQREEFLTQFVSWAAPVVMSAVDVRSRTGAVVRLYPILLPFTSGWIKRQIDAHRWAQPQAIIQHGVDLAQALQCQVVSLGQYTSIATLNGTRLAARGSGVTTGNSYAVALAIEGIERAQRESGHTSAESVLVIAGAAGNIGQVCAEVLAPRYRRTVLIGSDRPGSLRRLETLAAKLPNAVATTDLAAIGEGHVVVSAMNAVDAPLAAQDFACNAIFCDLSVPASWSPGAAALRPDVRYLKGGIAALPFAEDLEIIDFPLPIGQAYGCLAEALLLGFEGVRDATFTGALTPQHVTRVVASAARHGFVLADYRRSCVLGSEREEGRYARAC